MVVTTEEAAALTGAKPGTIRMWVHRGQLQPLQPGAHPLRFHLEDVTRVQRDLRPMTWERRLEEARNRWGAG